MTFEIGNFRVGDRIAMGAWTDTFMMGDVYGTVTKVGKELLTVKLDRSGRTKKVHPSKIGSIL